MSSSRAAFPYRGPESLPLRHLVWDFPNLREFTALNPAVLRDFAREPGVLRAILRVRNAKF